MTTWLRLTLVTMTVGGGFLGAVVTVQRLINWGPDGFQLSSAILLTIFLGLFVFVVASGLVFIADPRRTQLLVWALAMQLLWVSSPLLIYRIAAGAYVTVIAGQTDDPGRIGFHLVWTLGSNFQCYLVKQAPVEPGNQLRRACAADPADSLAAKRSIGCAANGSRE